MIILIKFSFIVSYLASESFKLVKVSSNQTISPILKYQVHLLRALRLQPRKFFNLCKKGITRRTSTNYLLLNVVYNFKIFSPLRDYFVTHDCIYVTVHTRQKIGTRDKEQTTIHDPIFADVAATIPCKSQDLPS